MGEKIGDFLVKTGHMSRPQVEEVLQRQGTGDGRLFGQIALELGFIEDNALKRFIDYKEKEEKEAQV